MNDISQQALRELTPTGKLRAAINYGNAVLAQRDPQTGELSGVTIDFAHEIGRRLGVEVELVPFSGAKGVTDSAGGNVWDVAFLAIDPVRGAGIDFTEPYVVIEGTYLVRQDSPLTAVEQFDRPEVRIALAAGSAYDLYLSRALKQAQLVRSATLQTALAQFEAEGLDAVAGVRQPLAAHAASQPGLRVIDGRFTEIRQAFGVPKGHAAAHAYVAALLESFKASPYIAETLRRHGQEATLVRG
ncbi:transporter substrate-binding domain-containing protein [Pigmentiphaga soli]|uniref:Transporter substrate-binding domain-containing protein n=1 Tax=Pigmentiphaga soli TaxID=1007095 RepID=A0ABP8GEF0_9BURK